MHIDFVMCKNTRNDENNSKIVTKPKKPKIGNFRLEKRLFGETKISEKLQFRKKLKRTF